MDYLTFQQLLSPAGQDILQDAIALSPQEPDFLIHYQSLTKRYPANLARAALEAAILRREATSKFPFADRLYLTREALEQASNHEIAVYRAKRFQPYPRVADLGCSVGSDTFALARIAPTLGLDHDRLRLSMASANLDSLGLLANAHLVLSDLNQPLPFSAGITAMFFDPGRRSNHQRYFSVHQYQPPLAVISQWLPKHPALGVKISPGVNLAEVKEYEAEVEFISLHGELKEAVLWFGPLNTTQRRATLLPGPHVLTIENGAQPSIHKVTDPKTFLYEPDPAVIRAGLVTSLAERLDASQVDADIAYLTSEIHTPTPFARTWAIEAWFPFQLKRLRSFLHQQHVGHISVKKRGSPLEPDSLIQQLRLKGDQERVVVLTRLRGEPIVMICIRV